MLNIGIDFGSSFCRLACLPEGSQPPFPVGQPVATWQAATRSTPDTYPYLVIKYTLRPPGMIVDIFKRLKEESEAQLKQPVTGCVVGVPVDAGSQHREQLRTMVLKAGFEAVSLISEPAALMLDQYHERPVKRPVLIFLLGDGSLTLSIFKVEGNNVVEIASQRSDLISGKLLTNRLAELLISRAGIDSDKVLEIDAWRKTAEHLKIKLSTSVEENVRLPQLDKAAELVVKRRDFEDAVQPLLQQSLELCDALLASTALRKEDLGEVWLAGRSQAIPLLNRMLSKWHGQDPVLTDEFAIARGCARQEIRMPTPTVQPAPALSPAPSPALAVYGDEGKLQTSQSSLAQPEGHPTFNMPGLWKECEQHLAQGDTEGALRDLERIDLLVQKMRGRIAYVEGRAAEHAALQPGADPTLLEKAARKFQKAVDMDAEAIEYKQARDEMERLKKNQLAREQFHKARAFEKQKKWREAAANYRGAHQNDPTVDDYLYGAANVYMALAEEQLQQVIEMYPHTKSGVILSKLIDVERNAREAEKTYATHPDIMSRGRVIKNLLHQIRQKLGK